MKKALITGITGQDGAYLSRLLLQKGYQVCGVVRKDAEPDTAGLQYLGIAGDVELVPLQLMDLKEVVGLIERIRPDEIYNLAAQSSVAASLKDPINTVEFNVRSALNVLDAMRVLSSRAKFYQASSSEMFGKVNDLPVTEKTVLHPLSPYAISKATGHWLAVNFREAYNLFCCCGILFNHESVLRPSYFVTKKILSTAVRIRRGAKEKLKLGNIAIRRDWGYAPEYVKAMWLMLQQEKADDYILATNEAHSLEEFVSAVFEVLKLNWRDHVEIDLGLYRPADIEVMRGDPRKAKEKLNWEYDISFPQLIETLVREEQEMQNSSSFGKNK